MKTYFLDTNALISYVTDRNPSQQEVVAPLFEAASRLKCSLLCHQFALTEFVFVMDKIYHSPKDTIRTMVQDFISMPGVTIIQQLDFPAVLPLWLETIPDFGDALVAGAAKTVKDCIVVTFDQKFKTGLKKLGVETL